MTEFVLATGSEEGVANALSCAQLVNLMTERQPQDARTQAPLIQAPGLSAVVTCGFGPIRGFTLMGLSTYVVSGNSLYQIDVNLTVTLLGSGIAGTQNVSITNNGTQVCIVNGLDGGAGWIWTQAGGLVSITSPNYFASHNVVFFDGYFLFTRQLSTQVFFSALYDGTTFSGTDFFSTESSSTTVQAIEENLQLLFIFKNDRIELWYDAGAADNPFQRYAGGIIEVGCAAPMAVVKLDTAIFFIGNDGIVYRLQANAPVRVSTHAMEALILAEAPNLFKATGFGITVRGHKLLVINLNVTQRTLVFDISTGKWHERVSYDGLGNSLGWWRGASGIQTGGGYAYVGDRYAGQIWNCQFGVFAEGASPLHCSVTSATLAKERQRLTLTRFELAAQCGVGVANITLLTSKDDGATFQNRGSRPIPTSSGLDQLMRWGALGSARQWTFQLQLNDPVNRVIVGASFDVEMES